MIADIVGHPKGAPTVEELDYTNPSLEGSEIRRHLAILQEEDIVKGIVAELGDRIQGFPYEFYRLTEYARTLFDQNGLFPEKAWRRQYSCVEKMDDIAEIEALERPH